MSDAVDERPTKRTRLNDWESQIELLGSNKQHDYLAEDDDGRSMSMSISRSPTPMCPFCPDSDEIGAWSHVHGLRSAEFEAVVPDSYKRPPGTLNMIPCEVLEIILYNNGLHVQELLRLLTVSKNFFMCLSSRSSHHIWESARKAISIPVPGPPPDVSELRWALFIFGEKLCSICKVERTTALPRSSANWIAICKTCTENRLKIAKNVVAAMTPEEKLAAVFLPTLESGFIRTLIPGIQTKPKWLKALTLNGHEDLYWKPTLEKAVAILTSEYGENIHLVPAPSLDSPMAMMFTHIQTAAVEFQKWRMLTIREQKSVADKNINQLRIWCRHWKLKFNHIEANTRISFVLQYLIERLEKVEVINDWPGFEHFVDPDEVEKVPTKSHRRRQLAERILGDPDGKIPRGWKGKMRCRHCMQNNTSYRKFGHSFDIEGLGMHLKKKHNILTVKNADIFVIKRTT